MSGRQGGEQRLVVNNAAAQGMVAQGWSQAIQVECHLSLWGYTQIINARCLQLTAPESSSSSSCRLPPPLLRWSNCLCRAGRHCPPCATSPCYARGRQTMAWHLSTKPGCRGCSTTKPSGLGRRWAGGALCLSVCQRLPPWACLSMRGSAGSCSCLLAHSWKQLRAAADGACSASGLLD